MKKQAVLKDRSQQAVTRKLRRALRLFPIFSVESVNEKAFAAMTYRISYSKGKVYVLMTLNKGPAFIKEKRN